jgi:hypothetical protein
LIILLRLPPRLGLPVLLKNLQVSTPSLPADLRAFTSPIFQYASLLFRQAASGDSFILNALLLDHLVLLTSILPDFCALADRGKLTSAFLEPRLPEKESPP